MQKYLDGLKDNEAFTLNLMVVEKTPTKPTKGDQKMIVLEVADKTKVIKARFFGSNFECDNFYNTMDLQKVYQFSGVYNLKFNSFIISKENIMLIPNPDLDEFILVVDIVSEQSEKLFDYINKIQDTYIKSLLESIFADDEILKKFLTHPAAVIHHHTFPNGLITHVLEMLEIAESISSTYGKINKDLLFCGCILHDIGKIYELKVEFGTKYTDEGELLSHMAIGHSLISEKISKIDNFPTKLASQIFHMILSHHGKPSWDKPSMVEPKTLESVSLHHIDMLSAKLSPIHDFVGESEGWQKISNNYYLFPPMSKD